MSFDKIDLDTAWSLIKENKNMVYLYIIYEDSTPFYVGIGKGDRIKHHERQAKKFIKTGVATRNMLKTDKLCSMLVDNKTIYYSVPFFFSNRKDAEYLEEKLITEFGRICLGNGVLTNLTSGGEGIFGYVWSEERREQHKQWLLENGHPCTGNKLSEETKRKISEANSKQKDFRRELAKRMHTPEAKAKASAGRVFGPETRMKMSINTKNMFTEEFRASHSKKTSDYQNKVFGNSKSAAKAVVNKILARGGNPISALGLYIDKVVASKNLSKGMLNRLCDQEYKSSFLEELYKNLAILQTNFNES